MCVTNLLEIYHNSAYYLCLCPFKIVRIPASKGQISVESPVPKRFKVNSWLPQKVFCALFNLMTIFWLWMQVKSSIPENIGRINAPVLLFRLIIQMDSFMVSLLTIHSFWTKQNEILEILDFVKLYFPEAGKSSKFLGRFFVSFLCFLHVVLSLWKFLAGPDDMDLESDTSHFKLLTAHIIRSTKSGFHFPLGSSLSNDTLHEIHFGTDNIAWAVIGGIAFFQQRIFDLYGDFLLTMAIVTLWVVTKDFIVRLSSGDMEVGGSFMGRQIYWIQQDYTALQDLTEKINNVCSKRLVFYMISIVLYFSTQLDATLSHGKASLGYLIRRLTWLTFLLNVCFNFHFAADICRQVRYSTLGTI